MNDRLRLSAACRCIVAAGVFLAAPWGHGSLAAEPEDEPAAVRPGPAAAPLFWCDSTDPAKLDLTVERQGDRYWLTNVAPYHPPDKNCYYYVNWDLQGDGRTSRAIAGLEVEPNSLYLVHLYELPKPKTLGDFWSDDPGKEASAAMVWVGGEPAPSAAAPPGATGTLREIRETPQWFYYTKGDRLPFFSQRFPEFRLPPGKLLSLNMFRAEDTVEGYLRHGVTHFPPGGADREKPPRAQRLLTIGSYFNQGIGEKPSGDPHISPTEMAFMESPYAHAVSKAGIAADYDYIFLDEEFWHNDYQTATIERLCLFAREARRINPTLKLADFWNPPPYRFQFARGDEPWTIDTVRAEAVSHYDSAEAALKAGNPALLRKVTVGGQPTSLAEELSAVSQCVYFDNLFGFIPQYGTFSLDYFVPAAIHTTRVNRLLPCNQGKPLIWFGMDILEGNYRHPRIAYPTRTTNPPGLAIFKDRLLVSPNYNEALALFGLLEGDGVYLWDAHGISDGDPNGIFSTLKYCQDYHDDRGEWRPDSPGEPLGEARTWYPPCMAFAPDYYALGAWKFSQIADVVTAGRKLDFEYSLDDGKTWYLPPANGATMADVIHDKRPIVAGAVHGQDIAVVAFHPFQGVADTTSLQVRCGKSVFAIRLFGTRARVYRGVWSD